MIKKIYFVKENPSIESDSEGKDFSKKVEELFFSLNKDKCEDCDCDCKFDIEEDLEDYDEEEDFDEEFEEEEDSFKKNILIKRDQIQEDEYEFNFFDEETEEFVWSFYSCDFNFNEAKEAFLEEFDHLDVTFYLAE